jgi:hypothetical protein
MPDSWEDDPNTWLSNHDIDKVMQRMRKLTRFVYLTTQPSDFMSQKRTERVWVTIVTKMDVWKETVWICS